ncbi:MAG: hypothetical protein FWH56_07255 [Betaproteobacteria bacterium]|nr:hypothetical protein [Betaproteobacteria bacterium]
MPALEVLRELGDNKHTLTHVRQTLAGETWSTAATDIPPVAVLGATGKPHTDFLFLSGCL